MSEQDTDKDLIPMRWRVVLLAIVVLVNAALFCKELWEAYGHASN